MRESFLSSGGTLQTSVELACWMSDCLKVSLVQGITSAVVGSVVESQPLLWITTQLRYRLTLSHPSINMSADTWLTGGQVLANEVQESVEY